MATPATLVSRVGAEGGGAPAAPGVSVPAAAAVAREPMDETAFRELYDRTASALRAYLARVSGSRSLADDLLQESYLRLLRSGFAGNDDDHVRRYLFRIATNLLRDHYRRPRRETHPLPDDLATPAAAGEVELRRDFHGAFATLPARERSLLWLAYVEGLTHVEIGAALRVKAASVRVLLFRARTRLAGLLRARGLASAVTLEDRS